MRRLINYVRSGRISRPSRLALLTAMLVMVVAQMPKGASPVRGMASAAMANPPIVVTTLVDEDDGTADPSQGTGTSLREAINAANAVLGDDEINFSVSGTITLTMGELTIVQNLTISGPGAQLLLVSGNNASRIFHVTSGSTVTISSLTISNGHVGMGGGILNDSGATLTVTNSTISGNVAYLSGSGGGIRNDGMLTVTNSTISANFASSNGGGGIRNLGTLAVTNSILSGNFNGTGFGGGIWNDGVSSTVTVTNSVISGNSSSGNGGGIRNDGTLTVTGSTVSGNQATGGARGGGIFNVGTLTITDSSVSANNASLGGGVHTVGGTVGITNSTISRNISSNAGGGINNELGGTVTVRNSTITGNSALGPGAGIDNGGTLTLYNTIVAGNPGDLGTIDDLSGGSASAASAYNLIGDVAHAGGLVNGVNGNIVGVAVNTVLDPTLADNGGPTKTHKLVAGSPAINAGSNALAVGLTYDQRGIGFPRISGGTVDIGSFELSLYNFTGFFQPVDNLPTVNSAKAGSSIPVKFSLGGNQGLDIFAPGYPVSQTIACNSGAPVSAIEETVTAGSSSLSYDAATDTYIYVWKTNSAWKNTCRKLTVKLNDGSTHEAAFQFK